MRDNQKKGLIVLAEIYSIRYEDRVAAALIYQKILENSEDLKVLSCGLEKVKLASKQWRSPFRLLLALEQENGLNLPAILKAVQNSLKEHPLYSYLSFDYCVVPISQAQWNFDSYDDPEYQKVFIRKRKQNQDIES